MNKVIMIGNLVKDAELVNLQSSSVCNFRIAVQRDYANAEGKRDSDFFDIKVFGKRGENVAKYLKKGNRVGIVGNLQNRTYEDADGIKRTITEIIANEVEFLTPKKEEETTTVSKKRELEEIPNDGLPF